MAPPRGRLAFLTMDDLGVYVADDDLALPPLAARGWDVRLVSWRAPDVRWSDFAGVVIRSTWDYHERLAEYLATLAAIAAGGTPLANPLALVRPNVRKDYLLELAARGCPIVPTEVAAALDGRALDAFLRTCGAQGAVAKPLVGASGWEAFRVRPGDGAGRARALRALAGRATLLQPFVPEILSAGERSLVYFGGAFSHAFDKHPAAGEFRVQEEHGGIIARVEPDAASLELADALVRSLAPTPLYARVDLVRPGGRPLLMELELVEPSLYLRTDAGAPERFAAAVDAWARAAAAGGTNAADAPRPAAGASAHAPLSRPGRGLSSGA